MSLRAETRTKGLAGAINVSLLRSEDQGSQVLCRTASHFFPFRVDILI